MRTASLNIRIGRRCPVGFGGRRRRGAEPGHQIITRIPLTFGKETGRADVIITEWNESTWRFINTSRRVFIDAVGSTRSDPTIGMIDLAGFYSNNKLITINPEMGRYEGPTAGGSPRGGPKASKTDTKNTRTLPTIKEQLVSARIDEESNQNTIPAWTSLNLSIFKAQDALFVFKKSTTCYFLLSIFCPEDATWTVDRKIETAELRPFLHVWLKSYNVF